MEFSSRRSEIRQLAGLIIRKRDGAAQRVNDAGEPATLIVLALRYQLLVTPDSNRLPSVTKSQIKRCTQKAQITCCIVAKPVQPAGVAKLVITERNGPALKRIEGQLAVLKVEPFTHHQEMPIGAVGILSGLSIRSDDVLQRTSLCVEVIVVHLHAASLGVNDRHQSRSVIVLELGRSSGRVGGADQVTLCVIVVEGGVSLGINLGRQKPLVVIQPPQLVPVWCDDAGFAPTPVIAGDRGAPGAISLSL